MTFRGWVRHQQLVQRLTGWGTRSVASWMSLTRVLWRLALAVSVALPYLATWYNPHLIWYALGLLGAVLLLTLWHQWTNWRVTTSWLVAGFVLTAFWGSTFAMWLFLENSLYRVALLGLVVLGTWWYLGEWQRLRHTMFVGEAGAGATPTLLLGFIACFSLGAVAESFLVYLNTPLWRVGLACWLPAALLVPAFVYASGWSLLERSAYWITGMAVMLQVFILATWWPTSFYVVGFTLAVTYTIVALLMRQEAQGFLNRRSLARELGVVGAALGLVLLTARWF